VKGAKGGVAQAILTMMRRVLSIVAVGFLVLGAGAAADAGVWRWNDGFIAAFVDAEGINLHPGSAEAGEEFDGQMMGTRDVGGPGVDVYYHLVDAVGNPVDNSVAGLEVWKPDGADWLGQGATSGLGLVTQWGRPLHMNATGYESCEIPLWYRSGAGAIDVRAFCITGTAAGWTETQMNSAKVTLNKGEVVKLMVDLTGAPDITRMVKVGVVVEAHDGVMAGQKLTLHIGSIPVETVRMENYGPNSAYRWLDVADQAYSTDYQSNYSYDDANVVVTYNTVGQELRGTLTATNLKPNFAYQFKLIGEQTHRFGDTNYGCNELVGLNGRWWEQEWMGRAWSTGWNLNDKGDGSSPNPNDIVYYARRDVADPVGGSPTGLRYLYSGYRVFRYFITDENGDATLDYTVDNCYHVLWKTSQRSPGSSDGPVASHTFDVDPLIHSQYDTNYGEKTVGVFGEWERLPKDGVGLLAGDYTCDALLTEESFHGSGLQGFWAHAMKGRALFTILPEAECITPIKGDLNNDCKVDMKDVAELGKVWLQCNLDPPEACWE
jgi:hypothetical protein